MMSANVFFWIIPGQKQVIADMRAGRPVDPVHGPARQAAQRAQHLFHAAGADRDAVQPLRHALSARAQLAVLIGLMLVGALVRTWFVKRHKGANAWPLLVIVAALLAALITWLAPRPAASSASAPNDVIRRDHGARGAGQGQLRAGEPDRRRPLPRLPQRGAGAQADPVPRAPADRAARRRDLSAGRGPEDHAAENATGITDEERAHAGPLVQGTLVERGCGPPDASEPLFTASRAAASWAAALIRRHDRDLHQHRRRDRRPDPGAAFDAQHRLGGLHGGQASAVDLLRQPGDAGGREPAPEDGGLVGDPARGLGRVSARPGVAGSGDAPLRGLDRDAAGEARVRRLSGGLRFPLRLLVPDPLHRDSPFSFSALDIKSYAMAVLKTEFRASTKRNMPKSWFDPLPHTHVALDERGGAGRAVLQTC
ncbi:hypothetical protein Ddc_23891 [Ditylenchus destructor]|nr:hypothetical protein Ddc_23891 [Ditylenchus destructor]